MSASRTGRPVRSASSAVWPWTLRSSLPPKAPPVETWVTRTARSGQPQERGDLAAVLPGALALRVDAQRGRASRRRRPRPGPALGPGTARHDSGSRKACSMACVRNDSVATWAAPASAASTSPRCTTERDTRFPPGWSAGGAVGQRRERVGDRLEDLVLDLDQRRRPRARRRASRRRRPPARRRRSASSRPRRRTGGQSATIRPWSRLPGTSAAVRTATTPGSASGPRGVDPPDDRARDGRRSGARRGACPAPAGRPRTASRRGRARAPRTRRRSRSPTAPDPGRPRRAGSPRSGRGRGPDRVDDLHVAGAPTEVPGEGPGDLRRRVGSGSRRRSASAFITMPGEQ